MNQLSFRYCVAKQIATVNSQVDLGPDSIKYKDVILPV